MARVTLIRPAYSAQVYGNVYEQKKNTAREIRPPLGLMALGGYLKTFGHDVFIVDGEPDLLDEGETVERVLATDPQFVGITSTTPEYPFAYGIVRQIKRAAPSLTTIFGGAHITNLPEHTMADLEGFVDWGVIWEGEKPLAAIIDGRMDEYLWRLDAHPRLLMAKERLSGEELECFEPARDILDMTQYKFVDTAVGLVQNDALEIARGCPFACAFCTSRKTLLNSRSVDAVMREIIGSATRYGTELFMFFDDTLTIHKKNATELFNEIIKAKKKGILDPGVHFYGFTRANTLHDFEFLRLMKDAGCDKITLGIETGNADILRATQKGTKKDDYRVAYSMMEELAITKRGSFILGHPYETEDTIRDTIDFALELNLDEVGVNIMTPYPGQQTYRDALEGKGIWLSHQLHYKELRGNGQLHDDWRDFGAVNWHDYWRDHLRWGRSVVETETLSHEALVYWHGRVLQEIYGSDNMARRRQQQIAANNNDDYWHRPWRVNAARNKERIEQEKRDGEPVFPAPLHQRYIYDPIQLKDYQKNELIMTPGRRREVLTRQEEPLGEAVGGPRFG